MRFEPGKFYSHEGGRQIAVHGPIETYKWGPCFVIEEAEESAFEGDIPDPDDNLDAGEVAEGTARFVSRMVPDYARLPFWESYGMEWQLQFPPRGQA